MAISSSCHVTCSLTAISSSCHLLPSAWWSLCTQCSCLWKCAVQCSCLWICTIFNTLWPLHTVHVIMEMFSICPGLSLTFVSPSLLMALNLSLHSDKWWTSISKALYSYTLLKQYMFGATTWLNATLSQVLKLFVFSSVEGKEPQWASWTWT